MAIYGNNGNPGSGSGYFFDDTTSGSQYGTKFFVGFPGGFVTDIYVYVAGDQAAHGGKLCIWDGGDNLRWNSAQIGLGTGSRAVGGQGWVHQTPNVYIPSSAAMRLGLWTGEQVVWTFRSSDTVEYQHSVAAPGHFTGAGTDSSGGLYAYLIYTPTQAYVNTGTSAAPAWTAGQVVINTGTPAAPVWTAASEIDVNTGTSASPVWTPAS